ncbi:sporulation protein [Ectobacillus polymachus]|uniref:sporulation protein n=1 Tax=Ectobacillus polymachus TaxID=1508806 RepID=UPI003A862580
MNFTVENMYPVLFILLILYVRVKRSIGFQPFKVRKFIIRIIIFSILILVLLAMSATHPISYLYDLAGIVVGGVLATYAMKHSLFELREQALFYRTHIWIESIVLFLFLSRFFYRLIYLFSISSSQSSSQLNQNFAKDPLTYAVFFLLAVYYIGYYSFVLQRGKRILHESRDSNLSL